MKALIGKSYVPIALDMRTQDALEDAAFVQVRNGSARLHNEAQKHSRFDTLSVERLEQIAEDALEVQRGAKVLIALIEAEGEETS